MKIASILFTFLCAVVLVGCKCPQQAVEILPSEATHAEIRYEKIYEKDTVYISLPPQQAERTTFGGKSFLENDYAETNAWINDDGSLFHNLTTKQVKVAQQIDHIVERRDSVIYHEKKVPMPYPVEAKLSKWQKVKIDTYSYLLNALLLTLVVVLRKPLISFVRRFV